VFGLSVIPTLLCAEDHGAQSHIHLVGPCSSDFIGGTSDEYVFSTSGPAPESPGEFANRRQHKYRSVTSSRGGCRFAHRAAAGTRVPGDTETRRNTRHHVRRWAYDDSFYPLLTSIFGPHRPCKRERLLGTVLPGMRESCGLAYLRAGVAADL
jgi:hypothetical protein